MSDPSPKTQKPPIFWLVLGIVLAEPDEIRGLAGSLVSLVVVTTGSSSYSSVGPFFMFSHRLALMLGTGQSKRVRLTLTAYNTSVSSQGSRQTHPET